MSGMLVPVMCFNKSKARLSPTCEYKLIYGVRGYAGSIERSNFNCLRKIHQQVAINNDTATSVSTEFLLIPTVISLTAQVCHTSQTPVPLA